MKGVEGMRDTVEVKSIREALAVDVAGAASLLALGGLVRLRAIDPGLADKLVRQAAKLQTAVEGGDVAAIGSHGAAMGRGWKLACEVLTAAAGKPVVEPSGAARDFANECARRWPGAVLWDERMSLERPGEP
jgi:hypothetical protein